jgi:hypothetical protein
LIAILPQILLLLITAYQDFKDRAISWFLIPLLAGLGLAKAYFDGLFLGFDYLASGVYLTLIIGLVYLYFAFKNKSFQIDFTNNLLGIGDILFFIAMIPFFSFELYILLFVLGLIFSLIAHLIFNKIFPSPTIPLAGWLSLFYSGYFILNLL